MFLEGKITLSEFAMYVVAQMLGGYLALKWVGLEPKIIALPGSPMHA
jgi:hypothetical protein